LDFNLPGKDRQLGVNTAPPKSVCLLPFPFAEVLLQGETKQLRLYEDRFVQLFQDVMDNHEGVVAMGLIADTGIIQTIPLCEVEASNTMEGLGIFVTIRVVGRAQLLEITQQEPYLRGVCMEIIDDVPPNLELPNIVADNIEHCIELLTGMDTRLSDARKNKEIEDEEMDRRIALAKLVRGYLQRKKWLHFVC
jgi:Lon protease-like protein